jgi:hypothetical protein
VTSQALLEGLIPDAKGASASPIESEISSLLPRIAGNAGELILPVATSQEAVADGSLVAGKASLSDLLSQLPGPAKYSVMVAFRSRPIWAYITEWIKMSHPDVDDTPASRAALTALHAQLSPG